MVTKKKYGVWTKPERLEILGDDREFDTFITQVLDSQISGIKKDLYSAQNSRLIMGLAIEVRDLTFNVLGSSEALGHVEKRN